MHLPDPLNAFWHDEEGSGRDFIATNLGIVLGLGLLGWAIVSGSKATSFFFNPEGLWPQDPHTSKNPARAGLLLGDIRK